MIDAKTLAEWKRKIDAANVDLKPLMGKPEFVEAFRAKTYAEDAVRSLGFTAVPALIAEVERLQAQVAGMVFVPLPPLPDDSGPGPVDRAILADNQRLRSIVADLADGTAVEERDYGRWRKCLLCMVTTESGTYGDPITHAESCPYRRAREYMESK